jgi:hypothetical protein
MVAAAAASNNNNNNLKSKPRTGNELKGNKIRLDWTRRHHLSRPRRAAGRGLLRRLRGDERPVRRERRRRRVLRGAALDVPRRRLLGARLHVVLGPLLLRPRRTLHRQRRASAAPRQREANGRVDVPCRRHGGARQERGDRRHAPCSASGEGECCCLG